MTRRTGDECDRCGRQIQFAATRDDELPAQQFCSSACLGRSRRDAAVWTALREGQTVAQIAERFDLRQEKVRQIITAQRARSSAGQGGGESP